MHVNWSRFGADSGEEFVREWIVSLFPLWIVVVVAVGCGVAALYTWAF